ncbi:DUF1036 domain-containing protein [Paracoccus pacificus]|uniref:DUF1036 domain-containing protein n=1 Tax=Paracoccus pacificus TaxID=1463598 RepID=A0ABW4R884_9RHOB
MRKAVLAMVVASVPAVFAAMAMAQAGDDAPGFRVCNQSFDVLNLAVGQPSESGFSTRGWWRIAPNQCATLIREPLTARYLYAFATDVFGKAVLAGAVQMCVEPRRFVIDGAADCLVRGYLDARFIEIDTGRAKGWTLFVAARPE